MAGLIESAVRRSDSFSPPSAPTPASKPSSARWTSQRRRPPP